MKKLTPKDIIRLIGTQIYETRIVRKISQEALAEAADLSRVSLSQIENGNLTAKVATYYRIAYALDIPMCDLFRWNKGDETLDEILFLMSDCSADEIRAFTEILRTVKSQFKNRAIESTIYLWEVPT